MPLRPTLLDRADGVVVGAIAEGVMFTSLNATVVALWTNTVGSNVMVKDPITGLTGAPARKLAVKLMVSVIGIALAVFVASAPAPPHRLLQTKEKISRQLLLPMRSQP
jgi:hypothetical protein